MSFFPKCTFQVLVPNGCIVAGEQLEGQLVLSTPEIIHRAERIVLVMESIAWAGYGSTNVSKPMFQAAFQFDLPKDAPFAAGEHRYPFVLAIPEWLPPAVEQPGFHVRHEILVRLDVDWAVDPVAVIQPRVVLKGRNGTRHPLTIRSHPSFHEEIVVEVTLASSVVAINETITGQIALRNGSSAQLEWIDLTLMSVAQIVIGLGDRRTTEISSVRIPANGLRDGAAVPFAFEMLPGLPPSFRTSFIDHDVVLHVTAQIPWRVRPAFEIPLEVLPEGSVIDGEAGVSAVGGDRLRRIARAMAQQSGLIEGARAPSLAFGNVGPVKLAIMDQPTQKSLGVELDFTFPDLELGILFGEEGMWDVIHRTRESMLLPQAFANYRLKVEPPDERPKIDDLALAKLIQTILGDPAQAEKVRFSDHHLAFRVPLIDDEEPRMIEIARSARAHAKVIGDAISNLPFPIPLSESRSAWEAIATEQSAFLIPTGPAIHGMTLRAQVLGGEERSLGATLRTTWKTETPTLQVVIDLRENPIPEKSWTQLSTETQSDPLKSVRAIFPSYHVVGNGVGVVLEDAAWPSDPRPVMSLLEIFLTWVIAARGERRADAPYR